MEEEEQIQDKILQEVSRVTFVSSRAEIFDPESESTTNQSSFNQSLLP